MSLQTTNGKDVAKIKREKYLRKQQKKFETNQKSDVERKWVLQHSSFVTWLEMDQVKALRLWRDRRCKQDGGEKGIKGGGEEHTNDDVDISNSDGERGLLLDCESTLKNVKKRKRQHDKSVNDDNSIGTLSTVYSSTKNDHSIDMHRLHQLIGPFLDLRDKNNSVDNYQDECGRRLFIAEGTTVVKLLIERAKGSISCKDTTNHDVISIIVKPQSFFDDPVNMLKTIKESFPSHFQEKTQSNNARRSELPPFPFHIFVGAESVLTEIAGFHISRGALGSGLIPHRDENWLYTYLETKIKSNSLPNIRILALDAISDTANLGSLIRSAAAFGIDCVVLSHDSCDAWYRRSVRVSMGNCFTIPSVRVADLASLILTMRNKFGIASYAAVVDSSAEIVLEEAAKGDIEPSWCCVLGNEGCGISSKVIDSCKSRIRIKMVNAVDSLSIGVAGAILLHGMKNK